MRPVVPQTCPVRRVDGLRAADRDCPAGAKPVWKQTENGLREQALAASCLANQDKHLTSSDGKTNVRHETRSRGVADREGANVKGRAGHWAVCLRLASSTNSRPTKVKPSTVAKLARHGPAIWTGASER